MLRAVAILLTLTAPLAARAADLPIFDAHVHYSHDAWAMVPPQDAIALAKQHGLMLHAHSDADAVDRLFAQWPAARILWAHAGFEQPDRVREMLRKHRNLWADLAFRTEHASGGTVAPEWRAAFLELSETAHPAAAFFLARGRANRENTGLLRPDAAASRSGESIAHRVS